VAGLLVFKEKFKEFYRKNEKIAKPIGRFIIALLVLLIINMRVPFFSIINNIFVIVAISAVCAFLDINFTVLFAGIVLILNICKISVELAVVVGLLYVIMFLFYFRFTKKEAVVLILLPIAFVLRIPYCIPIIMGLLGGLVSIIPVSFGVLLCFITDFVGADAVALSKIHSLTFMEKFQFISQRIFAKPEMLITMAAFAVTIVVVYLVRRTSINYAWLVSVIVGSVSSTIVMLGGYFVINNFDGILMLIVGELISCGIGIIIQLLYFSVDYSRVENVQFEDDEYYYYVKAVPKMSVVAPVVTVKRFTKTEPVKEGVSPEEIVSEGISEIKDEKFLDEFEDEFIKDYVDKKRPIR